nr:MAG TPA: hypothetical protein [Bacteriophage sp.]
MSNKFRALPCVLSHFTVLFLDRWGALQVCSVPHLFFCLYKVFFSVCNIKIYFV